MTIPTIVSIVIGGMIGIMIGVAISLYRDRHPRYKAFLLYRDDYEPVALKVYGKSWPTIKNIYMNNQAKEFDGYSDIEVKKSVVKHAQSIKGLRRKTMLHYNTTMGNVVVTLY